MGAEGHHDWHGAAASALAWWHEAGVDMLVDDVPRDWLAPPAAPPGLTMAAEPPPEAAPREPEAFLRWRGGPSAPESGWRSPVAAAAGPIDARIMVLVDCPDRDDGEALLSAGPAARLFDRMLAAIGLERGAIHLAAVFWRRPPPGRTPPAIEEHLHELARRHVALATPHRVLLLGDAAARAVTGTNMVAARGALRAFNHEGATTQAVASLHPRLLVERPAMKAQAWRDLQLLIGDVNG